MIKSKLFLLSIMMLSFATLANAQMTNGQIVDYAKSQKKAGRSNEDIGQDLLSKGVTREQMQAAYSEYNAGSDVQPGQYLEIDDRGRENNGETVPEASEDTKPDSRQIFGHEIFRSKSLSFEPNTSMAIPQNYVLGPGDDVIVDIYGASQSSQKITVAPDGTVTIPRIGPIRVSGLTVEGAQSRIYGAMGKHYQNSSIKVSVGQTRTIQISVMGEVAVPGTYTLSAFASVFHALYMAGGIKEIGTLRDIKVARNGRIISTVDVYEYILNGRLAGNVMLRDNDVIIVGSYQNLVNISGNIKRPMWYEMKKNETVQSLLRYAGGFKGDAFQKSVSVNRKSGDKYSVYTVGEFEFSTFRLADEDSVMIRSNEQRYENITTINGAVKRTGDYQLSAVKTVKGIIEAAGGLQEDAQTNRAVLIRTKEDRTKEAISIDLAEILAGNVPDIPLQNEDVITIASMETLNSERILTIEGEVYNPGTFPYAENTKIEDIIIQAGGLRESASLLNVEVARRIVDPSASTDSPIRSESFTFSLTDGLKVANGNTFTLMPFDRVYIRRSPVFSEQRTVNVSGEVMFAGNYVLKEQDVRISDIIKKAGGFKLKASVKDARLVRKMNEVERARQRQMLQMVHSATDSVTTIKVDSAEVYTVGIDLEKAMANPGSDEDIVLRDGDEITVPQLNTTVKINGEVLYPNSVTFLSGKNMRYYISQAGGFTKESHKSKSYVIYPNGHVAKGLNSKIEPGCEIVVPTKKRRANGGDATKWASLATGFITAAALVISVLKK